MSINPPNKSLLHRMPCRRPRHAPQAGGGAPQPAGRARRLLSHVLLLLLLPCGCAPPSSALHAALLNLCAAPRLATGRAVYAQLAGREARRRALRRRPANARRVFDRMPARDRVTGSPRPLRKHVCKCFNVSSWLVICAPARRFSVVIFFRSGEEKTPVRSINPLKNEVYTFYSSRTNHPQSKEIYARLGKLVKNIKTVGYVADTDSVHDVGHLVNTQ